MIKLRTLGESIIEIDGERFAPDSDALFAALVYLSAERGRQVSRTSLTELLWPHLTLDRGRHCLRQLLYRIRILGAAVDGARENLVLPESLVAPTFSAQPTAERLVAERMAGARVIGPYLPGYVPRDRPLFGEWLDRTRAAVEARVRRVVLEVVHAHKLRSEWDEVDALARDCLRLDPLNEEATLAVAEATAMNGGKHDALAIIDRYVEEIGSTHAELRIQPMVLRRRIAERMPSRRYLAPADRCFVGRSALMEALTTSVQRARAGDGSAALLVGAPGIGKTRLLQELTGHAVMQGVRVVRVGIEEVDLERPMAAFVDAVPQLRALPGAIGASPESLAFLERLTEASSDTVIPVADAADPRWIASRIRKAVVDLVDAVSTEGTIMLMIEDVHWLDAASWATISALLDIVPTRRLFVALTSRGPYPAAGIPDRCIERLFVHGVAALDDTAALTLVRAIAADHGGAIPEDALRWCVTVGEGNPFFLRELVVHCLEGGRTHAIPPSLQGLLDARISRLQPTAKRVLQAAAVLGDHATIDRVTQMLELPAHIMIGALEDLATASLIDECTLALSLRHVLVAKRTVDTMPEGLRRWLHHRAAIVLTHEESAPGVADDLLLRASHWKESGNVHQAITTLFEAALAMQRIGAIRVGIQLLDAALDLEPGSSVRASILLRLAENLALDAQWTRAMRACEEISVLLADFCTPAEWASSVLLGMEAEQKLTGDLQRLVDRAHAIAADNRLDPDLRIQAYCRGFGVAAVLGAKEHQLQLWAEVQSIATSEQSRSVEWLQLRVMFEASAGDIAVAIQLTGDLQRQALDEPDARKRLTWLQTTVDVFRIADYFDEAMAATELLLAEARRLGSTHFEFRALHSIAALAIESGQYHADSSLERLHEILCSSPPEWMTESLIEDQARLSLLRGNFIEARSLAYELYASVTQSRNSTLWHRRSAVTLLVEVLLVVNHSTVDDSLVIELEDIHTRCANFPLHDRTLAVLACAVERNGYPVRAKSLVEAYVGSKRRAISPWRGARDILGMRINPIDVARE